MNNIYISDYHHIFNDENRKIKIENSIQFLNNNAFQIFSKYKPEVCFIEYHIDTLSLLEQAFDSNKTCENFLINNDCDNIEIGQKRFNFLKKLYHFGVKIVPCDNRLWDISEEQILKIKLYMQSNKNPFNTSHSINDQCKNIKCNQLIVDFINKYIISHKINNYFIWFGEKHAAKHLLINYAKLQGCNIEFQGIAELLNIPYFQFDELQNEYCDYNNGGTLI